LLSGSFEVHPL